MRQLIRECHVSTIIHFAGSVIVPESVRNPMEYYFNNTINSCNLITTALDCGIERFIFSSTAAVYGNVDSVPVAEETPLHPVSPYGRSKVMTELMLADAHAAYGLSYAVLRYFNVAGADPGMRTGQCSPAATHLIKVAVQAALGRRPALEIFGTDYPTFDGSCVRDYIHVSDLVQAHVAALDYLKAGGSPTTFNCGYGRGFSVFEVVDAVKRASGVDFQVNFGSRRPGDPSYIVASVKRISELLAWSPKLNDLHTIVAHALEWEKVLHKHQ